MRLKPSHFDHGLETDCLACARMTVPGIGAVTGRASIRRHGRTYQAYLKLHPPHGGPFSALPRVEVIVHESEDLRDVVAWANRAWDLEDTVEE